MDNGAYLPVSHREIEAEVVRVIPSRLSLRAIGASASETGAVHPPVRSYMIIYPDRERERERGCFCFPWLLQEALATKVLGRT